LKEAHEKGVPIRELARITGISNATLGRWIKEAQEKEKQQSGESGKPS
jgi:transposase-like protein